MNDKTSVFALAVQWALHTVNDATASRSHILLMAALLDHGYTSDTANWDVELSAAIHYQLS